MFRFIFLSAEAIEAFSLTTKSTLCYLWKIKKYKNTFQSTQMLIVKLITVPQEGYDLY